MEKKRKIIYGKAEKPTLEGVPALKRTVDKRKIAAHFKQTAKAEPEIERISFLKEDVRTKERLIDKEKMLDLGTKLFGKEPETREGNLCSQKLDDLFTMKVGPKPAQDTGMKVCKSAYGKEIPEKQWVEQARSANREQNIDFLVKFIKSQTSLICIGSKRLYMFNGKVYEDISEQKRAATFFKQILDEKRSRLFRDYAEIHKQLLCDPEIALLCLKDHCCHNPLPK